MTMIIDPVAPSVSNPNTPSNWFTLLDSARQNLLLNSNIMNMVASIGGNVIFTTCWDGLTDPATRMYGPYNTTDPTDAAWRANLESHAWTEGDEAFSFIGTDEFSGQAGQLRYEADGFDTRVQADTDGDRYADFELELYGSVSLGVTDFIL